MQWLERDEPSSVTGDGPAVKVSFKTTLRHRPHLPVNHSILYPPGAMLLPKVNQLHEKIERLCNVKEMRTPVLLRAFVRWYLTIIFPIFLGFYGQNLNNVTRLPGMLGILIILVGVTLNYMLV
jgi:hypothetical protein